MTQTIHVEQLPVGFYLVSTETYKKNFLKQQNKRSKPVIGEIIGDWEQLPYLSLRENLLLGVDKTKRPKLLTYIKLADINPRIFTKQKNVLSQLDKIKLQFAHLLLKETPIIYFHDCFDSMTVSQMQWLLNFCQQLTQKYSLRILLFSENENLLHSPSIDEIF
ncbi:hypothetical protein [Tetragenococcus koreensis]|uniref:hypothetical protein n=1 Tax=Tetragenococcus koreensis TaxID=290335 RepID=UPI001F1DCD1B|nr:hypothetical protein [Tetragenococcus koreensis]MCF1631394.1 hypothetical protein [Tetragenococcus koreensis]